MKTSLKPHQVAILAAGLASVVLWAIPAVHFALLPLEYLNTHIHELCHAIVATMTGGQVQHIEVHVGGDGVTPILGGNAFLEVSAGYIGATIVGGLIMLFGRTEKNASRVLRVVAVVMMAGIVLWVRGSDAADTAFGIGSGVTWAAVLWLAGSYLKGPQLLFAAQFVGLQQCLNSVQSLYVLMKLSAFTEVHSDASIMQQLTGIPALAWAIGWSLFSLLVVLWGLKTAWKSPSSRVPFPMAAAK